MDKAELIARLVPVVGFMDEKTGLLYIQTPTNNFEDFIKLVEANDETEI